MSHRRERPMWPMFFEVLAGLTSEWAGPQPVQVDPLCGLDDLLMDDHDWCGGVTWGRSDDAAKRGPGTSGQRSFWPRRHGCPAGSVLRREHPLAYRRHRTARRKL